MKQNKEIAPSRAATLERGVINVLEPTANYNTILDDIATYCGEVG